MGFPSPNPNLGSAEEQEGMLQLVQMVFLGPHSGQLPVQLPSFATLLEVDGGASKRNHINVYSVSSVSV